MRVQCLSQKDPLEKEMANPMDRGAWWATVYAKKKFGVFILNSVDILNQITKNDFITVQEDIKSAQGKLPDKKAIFETY